MKKVNNPRILSMMMRQFEIGHLGHRCANGIPDLEGVRLLEAWRRVHGGVIFRDKEDVIGFSLCTCDKCEAHACQFVVHTGINLLAQGAGESDYVLHQGDANVVDIRHRAISAYEEARMRRMSELAVTVASEVVNRMAPVIATRIAVAIAEKTSAQVARRVADRVAREVSTGALARTIQRNAMISGAFAEQRQMLSDE